MAETPPPPAKLGQLALFDGRPIAIMEDDASVGFRLHGRHVEILGEPSLNRFVSTLAYANASYESSPWWVGDLLRYAETRGDWAERMSQAIAATGLSYHALENLASICRRVDHLDVRRLAPSITHADAVASMDVDQQRHYLGIAKDEGLKTREFRLKIRGDRRGRVIAGQADIPGMYRVGYADPPWLYGNRPPSGSGQAEHYPGMTIDALCNLRVKEHFYDDAVLFMWVTAPMLLENPGPREVLEAWGFTPKTGMVWDKVQHNFGNYVSVRHEHLIIATRGSCTPDNPTPMPDSVVTERQLGVHSEKPKVFRDIITKLYATGPYLELFGRTPVAGWTVLGNDARLWMTNGEGAIVGTL